MKKKHVIMAIAFFIVGLVYKFIFNRILQGENASLLSCWMQGSFLGMLSLIIYFMQFFFFGYCFDEKNDALGKLLIILENIVAVGGIMYVANLFSQYQITIGYEWMHLVDLFFAVAVVVKSNYDGKVLRKKRKK